MTREAAAAMPQPGFDLDLVAGEDRWTILADDFRWTFLRDGDRWAHTLSLGDDDPSVRDAIAASVEGDPGRDDPARVVSPAYQEVRPHPVAEGVCALLTGQSTPHHFSAVVTARRDGPGLLVEVDVADRCRSTVEVLAATYLVRFGSGALIDADPGRIVWGGEALGQGRLEFRTRGGAEVAIADAGRRASRVQALARIAPSTSTHRLYYSWRWTPGPGPGASGA